MKDLTALAAFRSPQEDEIEMYGKKDGGFDIEVNGCRFFVVSCTGRDGWEAISIRPFDLEQYPSKEDVMAIKKMFFEDDETISTISVELFRLPQKGANNG